MMARWNADYLQRMISNYGVYDPQALFHKHPQRYGNDTEGETGKSEKINEDDGDGWLELGDGKKKGPIG